MTSAKKILLVAAARPNLMKVAPLLRQLRCHPGLFRPTLFHAGQHYDSDMSEVFFDQLGLPRPDRFLGVGSGTNAEQTARVMNEFENVCLLARR